MSSDQHTPPEELYARAMEERGESRRELEQATAEAVLAMFAGTEHPAYWRLEQALSRYRLARGIDNG